MMRFDENYKYLYKIYEEPCRSVEIINSDSNLNLSTSKFIFVYVGNMLWFPQHAFSFPILLRLALLVKIFRISNYFGISANNKRELYKHCLWWPARKNFRKLKEKQQQQQQQQQ